MQLYVDGTLMGFSDNSKGPLQPGSFVLGSSNKLMDFSSLVALNKAMGAMPRDASISNDPNIVCALDFANGPAKDLSGKAR